MQPKQGIPAAGAGGAQALADGAAAPASSGVWVRRALPALVIVGVAVCAALYVWLTMLDTQRVDVRVARHRAELRATQLSEAASREFDVTLRSVDAALLRLRRVYVEGGGHFETAVQDVVAAYAPGVLQYVIVVGTDGYVSYTSGPEQARTWLGDRARTSRRTGRASRTGSTSARR